MAPSLFKSALELFSAPRIILIIRTTSKILMAPSLFKSPIIKSLDSISNINSLDDLEMYIGLVPKHVTLIPKIESVEGVSNIKQITDALGDSKIIMFDHDDLYSSIIKSKQPISKFLECFNKLTKHCNEQNVVLLRTIGVVFGDQEKKITDYIG